MGFREGVKLTPPPSISWFSSTPAGIGLNYISSHILIKYGGGGISLSDDPLEK